MVISRQWTGMRIKRQPRFYLCEKIFTRKMVILRTWIRKEVVFYLHWQTTKRLGRSRRADDVKIQWKQTVFRSTSPLSQGSAQKQRWWTNYQYTSALMARTIETVFRTLLSVNQLSIHGTVAEMCEECKSCHDRTGRPVLKGQILTYCLCQQVRWWKHLHLRPMILRKKKIYCKDTKNEWKGYHNKIVVIKIRTDAGFLTTVDVGQYFMTRDHNLQNQWHVVSTLCQETKINLTRKGWIWGNTKIGPCWKSQPATHKVNVEWKLELSLLTRTILTRGSEFLMAWTSWSRTWATRRTTTTSRKLLRCSSKILRWKRMYLLFASRSKAKAKPQRRSLASSSTKTLSIGERKWTDVDWARRLFACRIPSVKTTEYKSSSWSSTSRRWWSDCFQEIKRLSSESFCAISTLVWWNVEE